MIAKLVYWNDCRLRKKRDRVAHYSASYGMDKEHLQEFVSSMKAYSDKFFVPENHCNDYLQTKTGQLIFPSAVQTSYDANNTVYAHYFPTKRMPARKRSEGKAVIIIPHLGGNLDDYDSLAQIIAKRSVSALSVLMPYQGQRTPEGYISGELMVSANIKGTLDAFVQAVRDVHWATDWLNNLGYKKIGILGFSFGGIVASIATAHDRRLKAVCLCLSGAEPAKIIFGGIATQKIKESFLHYGIMEAEVRKYWQPINPLQYMHKMTHAKVLMVNTMLDTVFPKETILALKAGFDRNKVKCQLRLFPFPCGHYGAGKYTVAKLYLLGNILCFLRMI